MSLGCGNGNDAIAADAPHQAVATTAGDRDSIPPYTGTDERGIPNYTRRQFTGEERALLRKVYGVGEPSHLYISDSSADRLLKYDPKLKLCRTCYVNSYRIGFVSIRLPGESWEQLERRVRATPLSRFPNEAHRAMKSLKSLDPDIAGDVARMLADGRRAGFDVRVVASYRSPQREAFLMAQGGNRTHTLTSLHSYGRAIDLTLGDGNLARRATRERWIAFRRWVTHYKGDEFRILGTAAKTWDWTHVEMPSATIGFRSIEEALARARTCNASTSCDFQPHLPTH